MAFPTDPLDVTVEIDAGGWTDITTDTLARDEDAISVTRGRMSEGSRSTPTSCALSLRNTGGTYSPRNPASSLYGLIGRNTPLRVYTGTPHLGAGGGTGTASTSHVAPSVTATAAGLLVCGWMSDDPLNYTIPGSMTAGPAETDGTYSTMRTAYQSVSAGATGTRTATASTSQGYASVSAVAHGTITVQETLSGVSSTIDDVTLTTGAGTQAGWWMVAVQGWLRGAILPMPDAPYGDDGGWILLGDSDSVTGTFSGSTTVYLRTRIWIRRINTAGAQAVIFPGIAEADSSSSDNHAALYVLSGVTDWDIRATVEVPSWPQRWDISGNDVWVPMEAQGVLRRLGQGSSPLYSSMRRAITGAGATVRIGHDLLPIAYWPLEDGTDSNRAASGLPSGVPMLTTGTVTWASISSSGSAPLPDWSQATGSVSGPVTGVTSGDPWQVGCLVQFTGTGSWTALTVHMTGNPYTDLDLVLTSSVTVNRTDTSGSSAVLMTSATDLSDGLPHWVEIKLEASGGSVIYDLRVDGFSVTNTSTSGAPGQPTSIRINSRGTSGAAALGHVGIWANPDPALYIFLVGPAIVGHAGEVAGRRIERLCHEENIAVHIVGDPDDSVPMGAQGTTTLLDLIRECEDADSGILYEPREALGLAYRCASARYDQPVTLALTYGAAGEVAPPLEPENDDRYTANDVTASRPNGSSARYEVTSGALSTQDPPNGVGRYDTSVTVNVESDSQLLDQAGWRAHLGTWDEPRYPTVHIDLAALGAASKASLARTTSALDVGDRITVASPPVWLPPGSIDQHVEGMTEVIAPYTWDMRMVCSPAGPWQVATVDGDPRVAADGSTLAADITSSATSLLLASTIANGIWTQAAADFPLDIRVGAEQVTASAIAATVTDTFTRTTSNGWGTASSGQAWTVVGTASDYSTTGTLGRITTTTVANLYLAHLDTGATDHQVQGSATIPVVPTGAAITVWVAARLSDSSNYYTATLTIGTTGAATLTLSKRVAGSLTTVTSSISVGTHTAGATWNIALSVVGSTLLAKAWLTTQSDPYWQTSGTDTSLTTGTRVGCLARRETGNTNGTQNIDWDNVSVPNPQKVTITSRSVNGVTRAWTAGTEIDVWEPAIVSL